MPEEVRKLVKQFEERKPANETELRRQFVDPLFEALGWDVVDNRQVGLEPSVLVSEGGIRRPKRPDYGFRIGNTTHFFVETKMPNVNLKDNPAPAFQLRRYGWSGKTLVGILTDFEEFIVYDCRIQPQKNDTASKARLRYYEFAHYTEKWDEISALFSRQAVAGGSLRTLVDQQFRGFFSVDEAFLSEMEDWRETLAKDIALHNRQLSQRELNLLVQRTIDRIVFLRIAEDRDIEAYGRLRSAAGDGKQVYEELKTLFNEADDKYNSGLFHFGKEKRTSDPDLLSLNIHIPDDPLRHIIKNLYFPFSPYEFSVLPADILGQVYERFLGKVIELSASGAVRIEEKPEVRKAGGVYYTPTYIVDYIVENTVGDLLWGKSPEEVEKLHILDPACGSGSFLTGAYQYLLDWHLEYYSRDPKRYRNVIREVRGRYVLMTSVKRRILENNIYGVDLDQNAVEVSKLALLLKMLENEDGSDATGLQTVLFAAGERILPDLSGNIKWGNSLIGSDFFRGPQRELFDNEEEMNRIKAFNWDKKDGFPEIMDAGGFVAVIGNPPYRKERDSKEFIDDLRQSDLGRQYYEGKMDLWYFFLHRALDVVKKGGLISFIVSSYWMKSTGAKKLIKRLKSTAQFREVVDFAKNKIFKDVSGYHMIFVLENRTNIIDLKYQRFTKNRLHPNEIERILVEKDEFSSNISSISHAEIYTPDMKIDFVQADSIAILNKLALNSFDLQGENKYFEVSQGVVEATDSVTLKSAMKQNRDQDAKKGIFVLNEAELQQIKVNLAEQKYVKKYLRVSDVSKYLYSFRGYYLLYIGNKESKHIKENKDLYRSIVNHLDYFAPYITSSNRPYGIHRTRKPHFFTREKLLCPNMFDRSKFAYCDGEFYVNLSFNVIITWQEKYSLKYVLAILNSALGVFWFNINGKKRGVNVDVGVGVMRKFPIRTIDFDNPADKAMHDKMVELVDEMLKLHKELPGLAGEGRRVAQTIIETVDSEIDALVYRLYGLSEDERAIVKGG